MKCKVFKILYYVVTINALQLKTVQSGILIINHPVIVILITYINYMEWVKIYVPQNDCDESSSGNVKIKLL